MRPKLEHIDGLRVKRSFHYANMHLPYFENFWHYHPEMEITYVVVGKGMRYVGDNISSFAEGDLVLLGENLPHNWVSAANWEGGPVETHLFQFPLRLFMDFPEFQPYAPFFQECAYGLHFLSPSQTLIDKMEGFSEIPPHLQLPGLFEIISMLFEDQNRQRLSKTAPQDATFFNKEHKRLFRIKQFLHENLSHNPDLEATADYMSMTKTYFCKWFKKNTGLTFTDYLNKLRIEQASQSLIFSDKNIAEIAYEAGFQNISHFNRVFKEEKGVPPRSFRKGTPGSAGRPAYKTP
ncbi:MAG: helix-turn-helix domain-containing protein [Lewinellaceae bacterium]|nr:helix-turn-helix domain-containing protein [Lewinellaceae bacterium]